MSFTLTYPVFPFLAALTSTLTTLHIVVPFTTPPVHAYDIPSLILWTGSVLSFIFLIWTYNKNLEDLFCCFKRNPDATTKGVRMSTDPARENTRFKAIFIIACASAAILTTDLSQFYYTAIRTLISFILPSAHDPANRFWELFWGCLFLIAAAIATGAYGSLLYAVCYVPLVYLRGIAVEADVGWRYCFGKGNEGGLQAEVVELVERVEG